MICFQHSCPCFKSMHFILQVWNSLPFPVEVIPVRGVKLKNKSKPKQNKKVGTGLGDSFLHLKQSIKMLSTHNTFLSNSCETWHFQALLISQSYAPVPHQTVFSFMGVTSVPPDVQVLSGPPQPF